MNILRIRLIGYTRLSLRELDVIDITFTKKTQIILGSNGSGKSSLMRELSPLPGLASEYRKGGSKEIWIENNNKTYYLKCSFTEEGNFYDFICIEENLNPGRTLTVFKELVKEHFNYTQNLHDILTGVIRFHSLSVNERRQWFMMLHDVDYTYAFKYFQKLKEQIRDIQGAIKQASQRLSEEHTKLLTKEEEVKIRLEIDELRQLSKELTMSHRFQLNNTSNTVTRLDSQLLSTISVLNKFFEQYERKGMRKTCREIELLLNEKQTTLTKLRQETHTRLEYQLKLQSQQQSLSSIPNCNLVDIEASIKDIQQEIESIDKLRLFKEQLPQIEYPEKVLSCFLEQQATLQHYSETLLTFPRRDYCFEDLSRANVELADLTDNFKKVEANFIQQQNKILLLNEKKKAKPIDCPKCSHVWIPDYDEVAYEQACTFFNAIHDKYNKLQTAVEEKQKLTETIKQFSQTIQSYRALKYSHGEELAVFFDYLDREGFLTKNPEQIPHEYEKFKSELYLLVQADRHQAEIKEKEKIRTILLSAQAVDQAKISQSLEEENNRIVAIQQQSRLLSAEIENLTTELELLEDIKDHYRSFKELYSSRQGLYQEAIQVEVDNLIRELTHSVTLKQDHLTRQVNQIDLRKGIIKSIEEELVQLKEKEKLLKLAQDALSPTSGLIAKGLLSFIDGFKDELNTFIAKIWSYPLETALEEVTEDDSYELDYKFVVKVNGKAVSPDIAKTSVGMREILHFAFVLVSMKYLGLENYPVFLDEFAVNMDDSHRSAAYNVIEYLIDSTNFSQIFLVSHYATGYSSLSESEILVLCDSNVAIPSHLTTNAHVVFE